MFAVVGRTWSHLRFRALVPQAGDSLCHWSVELKNPRNLTIGDHVRINSHAVLGAEAPIVIEDFAVIAHGAQIETGGVDFTQPLPYPHTAKPIRIGRGAVIATGAIVLGGVSVGAGAFIGAGSVVTRDVPPNAVINAAPLRMFVRRRRTSNSQDTE